MRIEHSAVELSSQRTARTSQHVEESLRAWKGDRRPDFEGRGVPRPDPVQISQAAQALQSVHGVVPADTEVPADGDLRSQMIVLLLEKLTGRKFTLFKPEDLQSDEATQARMAEAQKAGQALQQGAAGPNAPPGPVGWGLEYDYHARSEETEQVSVAAQGVVRTQDGKEISFSLELNMSRQFVSEQNIQIRAGDAKLKDPLVVNFAGTAAQLTQDKFAFDIDSDGNADQISFVTPGSGFLALDRNGDGKVNNGSELFGATSGDGFGELAAYDQDGNQWIDENDAIYNQLCIWSKDEQGNDQLMALGKAGVGAVYLGHVTSQFSLTDPQNQLNGMVRSTGLFLREDGSAGSVQKIDLAV